MPAVSHHGRRGERLLAGPGRVLALPAWCAWRPLIGLRNLAYDYGWRPIFRLGVPVISIGNLCVGGTGKTPFVAWLEQELRQQGLKPAVLARGYGQHNPDGSNDEAQLLEHVVCNTDRVAGAHVALAAGADCLLLDDGFQHRRVHRDLDVVLIDATAPWGAANGKRGHILPLGLMRESIRALRRADVLVMTRSDQVSDQTRSELRHKLARFNCPVLQAEHRAIGLESIDGEALGHPEQLAEHAVIAVSGIGRPQAFERTLAETGARIIFAERYPDHHAYTPGELQRMSALAQQHQAWCCCTSKDAVKIRPLLTSEQQSLWRILPVAMAMNPQDQQQLHSLMDPLFESDR